jgi:hypothetical protein
MIIEGVLLIIFVLSLFFAIATQPLVKSFFGTPLIEALFFLSYAMMLLSGTVAVIYIGIKYLIIGGA